MAKTADDNCVYIGRRGNTCIIDTGDPALSGEILQALTYKYTTYIQPKKGNHGRNMGGRKIVSAEDVMAVYLGNKLYRGARKILTMTGCLDVILPLLTSKGKPYKIRNLPSEDGRSMYRVKPAWNRVDISALRHRQTEALSVVAANDYARLVCPTAYGKSYLIAAICEMYPGAKIAVTSYAISVMQQIYDDLRVRLGPENVTLINSKVNKNKINYGANVTCISAGSLLRLKEPPDILIVDEVHEFASDSYKETLMDKFFRYTRMYGLSANAKRSDGREKGLLQFFGDIKIHISNQEAVDKSMVVPIEVGWIDIPYIPGLSDSTSRYQQMTGVPRKKIGLWRNDIRNLYIAKAANMLGEDTQVLITVQTIEHALHLKKVLPDYTLVYRNCDDASWERFKRQGIVPAGMYRITDEEMERYRRDFTSGKLKKVIATTVWNRGMNFKQLAAVIRADGTDSEVSDVQIPGRVARLHESKEIGLVIDIQDSWDDTFSRKSDSRRRRYAKMGWKQFKINLESEES